MVDNNNKILMIDIETKPAQVYVWRAYGEQNIGVEQIIDAGSVICVGLKWLGHKETFLYSEWRHGREDMLKEVHSALSSADAVVTYNGDKFDLPKLQGEFLLAGLGPTPPLTSIDVVKSVRRLGYFVNKLAFIGPFLGVGAKIKHEGFDLWVKVAQGNKPAQDRMARYCKQDVKLLEALYLKVRPFIASHPHMGRVAGHECGACGSNNLQSRGHRRTKAFRTQRLQCQACGSWQAGKREKVA
jgi:hypothetical protein